MPCKGFETDIEELTLPILVATAVLHNIAIRRNDVEDFEEINCNAEVNDIFEEENEARQYQISKIVEP
ncbi:hypothetical protein HUJ05_009813 [Dendroctonus ponderosae]|nr:hypothetical protein HUJ05_009813 [Dendroctonus ponderosae]